MLGHRDRPKRANALSTIGRVALLSRLTVQASLVEKLQPSYPPLLGCEQSTDGSKHPERRTDRECMVADGSYTCRGARPALPFQVPAF